MDLKTESIFNKIVTFAYDTLLLVPYYSSLSLEDECQNLFHWSTVNRLNINADNTKEIVFRLPGTRIFITPAPLSGIEQIILTKF